MQPLYRAEFFSRDCVFLSFAPVYEPMIALDYLTLESNELTLPETHVDKGVFVHVVDAAGQMVYQGIVQDVEAGTGTTKVKAMPLLSLLDVDALLDAEELKTGAVEESIKRMILETYAQSGDPLQDIPGIECEVTSETFTHITAKGNLHKLWDVCLQAFTGYGVAVNAHMDFGGKTLCFTIGQVPGEKIIEADIANCLAKNITIGDNYGALNKVTFVCEGNESCRVTYYLHPDGGIDTEDTNRVAPVFLRLNTCPRKILK